MSKIDLASITAVAERTITNDLEYLIERAVKDPKVSSTESFTHIRRLRECRSTFNDITYDDTNTPSTTSEHCRLCRRDGSPDPQLGHRF